MDFVFASIDLARAESLRGPETAVHRVQSGEAVLFEGQDDLSVRTPVSLLSRRDLPDSSQVQAIDCGFRGRGWPRRFVDELVHAATRGRENHRRECCDPIEGARGRTQFLLWPKGKRMC